MNSVQKRIPGTGWKEQFLGGSFQEETRLFAEVMGNIDSIQTCVSRRQGASVRRAFHNKGRTLKVQFTVAEDIPEHLQTSTLSPGSEYEGYARFSRSQSLRSVDKQLDQRGFAFRLLTHGGMRQDFLFSNTPVCFAPDPVVFLKAGYVFASSPRPAVPFKLVRLFGFKAAMRILRSVLVMTPDRDISFTSHRYWSRTPFKINDSAVKFLLKPNDTGVRRAKHGGADFLDQQLNDELAEHPVSFTLSVQHFVDDEKTPMERADVDWLESDSSPVAIGTLTLPKQELGSGADRLLQESIEHEEAFNPWVTEDILPLGSMNRSRREAYETSAKNRGGQPGKLCPFHHSSK